MIVQYSNINLCFYTGLLYYRLGEVGLSLPLCALKTLSMQRTAKVVFGRAVQPREKNTNFLSTLKDNQSIEVSKGNNNSLILKNCEL